MRSFNSVARILLGNLAVAILAASSSAQGSCDLWKIDAEGGHLAHFADTPGYVCGSPDWSPDGKRVAYDTWKIGQKLDDSQIAIVDADSRTPRLIGPGAMPSWSPDGKQLVAHTYDNPQTIVVMNADGTGRETILNHWGSPRWSPRGNRIASILDYGITLYDMTTGTETRIINSSHRVHYGFAIAPDGKRICFGGSEGGLYLATIDEEQLTSRVRTLADSGMSHHASFAPDGKRVVYSWQPDDKSPSQLYIRDVDSDESAKPIAGQNKSVNNLNPDWSPDGKTILFVSRAPTSGATE